MLVGTHVAVGIATAILVTQPKTVPEVVTSIIGGGIGGWIVDVDCKDIDVDREKVYDTIISALIIAFFLAFDFFIKNGMCHYVISNWGVRVWGGLFGLIILMLVGYNTNHRAFTHSILGLVLFSVTVYFFCRPAVIPFALGYLSHIVIDLTNKRGIQILFPFKWKPCLNLCYADKKANKILFYTALIVDVLVGSYMFVVALMNSSDNIDFFVKLNAKVFFGINILALYLIVINIITFLCMERNWKSNKEEEAKHNDDVRIQLDFEVWLIDILVFIGGGVGMGLCLIIHLRYPAAYNANWWSFVYASILFWSTVYCIICNPFGYVMKPIVWLSLEHLSIFVYILGINAISALLYYSIRGKRFNEYSIKHTVLWLIGAAGGTIGAIPVVIATNHEIKFGYVSIGFIVMLISQIVFVMYMMMVGIF